MGKMEFNKKKKEDALFNTAFELFTTKGLTKTTISDIVEKAGVAKGTFYLYFKDKYDIRNRLISHKTGELLSNAWAALSQTDLTDFEEKMLFLVDYILDELNRNHALLLFISKNLSWGMFKGAFEEKLSPETSAAKQLEDPFLSAISKDGTFFRDPEIMLFTIIELVGSTCHSCILYHQPTSIEDYKPHLHRAIHGILESFRIQPEETEK
ncbi:MAG: TetR/AcrR family transcriptional regulator [Eubacteriales bacterium]|nr:TetR/AcrR family transcriptional regulator [Eubacteriales bacterium]